MLIDEWIKEYAIEGAAGFMYIPTSKLKEAYEAAKAPYQPSIGNSIKCNADGSIEIINDQPVYIKDVAKASHDATVKFYNETKGNAISDVSLVHTAVAKAVLKAAGVKYVD